MLDRQYFIFINLLLIIGKINLLSDFKIILKKNVNLILPQCFEAKNS